MAYRKKVKKNHVISFRISDEELESMNRAMDCLHITRVSDLMRKVIIMATERPMFEIHHYSQDHVPVAPSACEL